MLVENTENLDDAILKATENPFDLIIIDQQHAEQINIDSRDKNSPLYDIPIIYFSSLNSNKKQPEEQAADYRNKITTPFLNKQLLDSITFVLKLTPATDTESSNSIQATINSSRDKQLRDLNAKILLVEDVIVNQKVALGLMKNMNFDIDVANNGKEALEMYKPGKYDLILMDCQMPFMDGFEATKRLRETDEDILIIAITANVSQTDKDKCFDCGMNDYLTKPFNKQQFVDMITCWLLRKQQTDTGIIHDNDNMDIESEATQTVDISKLDEMKSLMGELFDQLIPSYIEQSDNYVAELLDLLNINDLNTLQRHAHSLKSSSLNIGAQKLSDISRKLENMCDISIDKEVDKDILKSTITLISNEYISVKNELNKYK